MKEIRLYIINSEMSDPTDYNAVSDECFIKVAEEQGNVYSLDGFIEQINQGYIILDSNMDYIRIIEAQDEFFKITSVSRGDLEERGFDVSNVSDATMERLASKMSDDYCNQLFWESMEIIADSLGIKKIKKEDSKC